MKHISKARLVRNLPVVIAVVVIGLVCLLQALPRWFPKFDVFERMELMSYDWRVRRGFELNAPAADLGAVFIDDDSLEAINDNFGFVWPWPRQLYGRLVAELTAQGAKSIGFDMLFLDLDPPRSETTLRVEGKEVASDDYFAATLARSGNVVLATVQDETAGEWRALVPPEIFRTNACLLGHISSDADPDGVLRRARAFHDDPKHGRLWHMGIVLAARELGLDLDQAIISQDEIRLDGPTGITRTIPIDEEGFLYIDWALTWNDPRLLKESFESILMEEIARDRGRTNQVPRWEGKTVVVGSIGSGNNIRDFGATPLARQTYLVSKHWNVANSIILNRFVRRSSYSVETLLILLLGGLAAVITWRLRALAAAGLVVVVLVLYVGLALFLFTSSRYWFPLVLPGFVALLMTHVSMVSYRAIFERKEGDRIRSVFAKVVSADVVNELLRAERVALGGARRKVTVYFADIRGFTQLTDESQAMAEEYVAHHGLSAAAAEALLDERAREVLSTVNLYLGKVADTIKEHHGTLDKYIGDCVMAFWGAPTPSDRQAVDCVRAAIVAQQAVRELNQARAADNLRRREENKARVAAGLPPLPLLMLLTLGSGINTGMATVGLMGSDQHLLNYTVFGREVNLASRLEGLSGRGRIIISHSTFGEVAKLDPDVAACCVELPPARVKGFREPVRLYEVRWA
ncbi:MAG: adenylate/guanylate cyclase domain-containing protein, partial [Verrucomicrobia bacterium]|nr:adenylate/guanylate cyclase domain-containing protein [Verrucomicrobiota bacterium]